MIHQQTSFAEVLFLSDSAARGVDAEHAWAARPATSVNNRQIHSSRVVDATPGVTREADGLVTRAKDLCLEVVTADCVPVLIATPRSIAAVHAGWRGLAGGILAQAIARLDSAPESMSAWIGPAIGPCCYEVGEPVAQAVAQLSGAECVLPPPGAARGRPHLDLQLAARRQLEREGLRDVRLLRHCTYCGPLQGWSSYRRDGRGAGRNRALIWRR